MRGTIFLMLCCMLQYAVAVDNLNYDNKKDLLESEIAKFVINERGHRIEEMTTKINDDEFKKHSEKKNTVTIFRIEVDDKGHESVVEEEIEIMYPKDSGSELSSSSSSAARSVPAIGSFRPKDFNTSQARNSNTNEFDSGVAISTTTQSTANIADTKTVASRDGYKSAAEQPKTVNTFVIEVDEDGTETIYEEKIQITDINKLDSGTKLSLSSSAAASSVPAIGSFKPKGINTSQARNSNTNELDYGVAISSTTQSTANIAATKTVASRGGYKSAAKQPKTINTFVIEVDKDGTETIYEEKIQITDINNLDSETKLSLPSSSSSAAGSSVPAIGSFKPKGINIGQARNSNTNELDYGVAILTTTQPTATASSTEYGYKPTKVRGFSGFGSSRPEVAGSATTISRKGTGIDASSQRYAPGLSYKLEGLEPTDLSKQYAPVDYRLKGAAGISSASSITMQANSQQSSVPTELEVLAANTIHVSPNSVYSQGKQVAPRGNASNDDFVSKSYLMTSTGPSASEVAAVVKKPTESKETIGSAPKCDCKPIIVTCGSNGLNSLPVVAGLSEASVPSIASAENGILDQYVPVTVEASPTAEVEISMGEESSTTLTSSKSKFNLPYGSNEGSFSNAAASAVITTSDNRDAGFGSLGFNGVKANKNCRLTRRQLSVKIGTHRQPCTTC